jgi:hypothetical protein
MHQELTFYTSKQGFGAGRSNKGNGNQRLNIPGVQPTNYGSGMPGLNTQSYVSNIQDNSANEAQAPEQPKYFFQEKFAKLVVKGSFMPLAAQPKNVDLGDWLAHQCNAVRNSSNDINKLINLQVWSNTVCLTS